MHFCKLPSQFEIDLFINLENDPPFPTAHIEICPLLRGKREGGELSVVLEVVNITSRFDSQ